jgi:hypothetical protein
MLENQPPLSDKRARKMAAALTGVEIAESWPDLEDPKRTGLLDRTRPPSYLVRATFEQVFGVRLPSPHEKSAWGVPILYKGEEFELSDWKRTIWKISGHASGIEIAKELEKKISSAAKILDGHIREVCRGLLDKDQLSLDNQFHRYRALFDMFRIECEARLQRPLLPQGPKNPGVADLCKHLESSFAVLTENSLRLRGNLLAAAIFFFSLSEIIFDACFALGDRKGLSFRAFRKLEWSERFRFVLPSSDEEVRRLYNRLVEIRRVYRNAPVHADPVFAFDVKGVGLIPQAFDVLDNPNIKSLYFSEVGEVEPILACFNDAMQLFERHSLTRFGFAYAESGLAIHIAQDKLERHRSQMTSIGTFRSFLCRLVEYADAVANMEV